MSCFIRIPANTEFGTVMPEPNMIRIDSHCSHAKVRRSITGTEKAISDSSLLGAAYFRG